MNAVGAGIKLGSGAAVVELRRGRGTNPGAGDANIDGAGEAIVVSS